MKKLIAALVLSLSLALGFGASAMAQIVLVTPGTTVLVPCEAAGGAVTAFTAVDGTDADPPLLLDFHC